MSPSDGQFWLIQLIPEFSYSRPVCLAVCASHCLPVSNWSVWPSSVALDRRVAPDTFPNVQSENQTPEPALPPSLITTDTVTMATLSKHSSPVLLCPRNRGKPATYLDEPLSSGPKNKPFKLLFFFWCVWGGGGEFQRSWMRHEVKHVDIPYGGIQALNRSHTKTCITVNHYPSEGFTIPSKFIFIQRKKSKRII